MPAEEGIRLHNRECLFSMADSSCKRDHEHTIGLGTRWTFHLPTEHDELLPEQGVFGDEVSAGAS